MSRSLVPETYHDVWNPSAAVLPLALLMFVSWSLACGKYRLLPLAVLLASFVAQCHLTYVAPALGLLAVGLAGLILWRRWTPLPERGSMRRWVAAAVLVALIICAALAVVTARTPAKPHLEATLGYTLWWGSPAGMFVWLVLGWGALALPRPRLRVSPIRVHRLAAALGVAGVIGAGAAVGA